MKKKILGHVLLFASAAWVLLVCCHSLLLLTRPILRPAPWTDWILRFPLPHSIHLYDWRGNWPCSVGFVGMVAGGLLLEFSRRAENKRRKESEA
jgi:hypothetical protein